MPTWSTPWLNMTAAPEVISPQDNPDSRRCWQGVMGSNGGSNHPPSRLMSIDISLSSDEFNSKVRKPYTLTKQRERWTETEHQKFIEALKLYGRAWRHIEEHIGTKTAVQIRSHAQKFFSKVERETSNTGSGVRIQEIEIPPPRPKRKPSHPYPRKAGNSPPFLEENGETKTNTNPFSTGYSLPANPIAFPPCIHNEGPVLGANAAHDGALGPYDDVGPEGSVKLFVSATDKVALQKDCMAETAMSDNAHNESEEKNRLLGTQIGTHEGTDESNMEAPSTSDEFDTNLPAAPREKALLHESGGAQHESSSSGAPHPSMEDFLVHLKSSQKNWPNINSSHTEGKTYGQISPHAGLQSNPAYMWMDSFLHYYGRLPIPWDLPPASYGPTHGHPACPTIPWHLLQASMMNHPAALAAAMAAARCMMAGTGALSPYSTEGHNSVPLFPDELNAAAFSAATASWWAFSGFVPPALGRHYHPPTGAMFSCAEKPGTAVNTQDQAQVSDPGTTEDEVAAFSSAAAQGPTEIFVEDKDILPSYKTLNSKKSLVPARTSASDVCTKEGDRTMDAINQAELDPCTSADELEGGEKKPREGSSSGSNTPAFGSHSSEPETKGSDVKEDTISCNPANDTHEGACKPVNGIECPKMKKGKHQHGDYRHGDNETGKRLKSCTHDMDSRKEVSQEGRKAFQALFTCKTLPQTFRKVEDVQNLDLREKITSQVVSGSMKYSASTQVEVTSCQLTESERAGGDECMMVASTTTDDEAYTSMYLSGSSGIVNLGTSKCSKAFSVQDGIKVSGKHTSLSIKSRTRRSGFVPYQKPPAGSMAHLHSAVGSCGNKK